MKPHRTIITDDHVTIPAEVREALDLKAGEELAYRIEDGIVILCKAAAPEAPYLRIVQDTLEEWNTPEDAEAYDRL